MGEVANIKKIVREDLHEKVTSEQWHILGKSILGRKNKK